MGVITADIRRYIEHRILNFESLLLEHLTPLLRKQAHHAIALHREALKHSNVDPYLKDLDDLHEQLTEHWTKVYGDFLSRVYLSQDILAFYQFLIEELLKDYANQPSTVSGWTLNRAKYIAEQDGDTGAKDNNNVGTLYQIHVVYPLEEMMVNREHVESKLRSAAAGQGSDIQRFIDKCDWSSLATALINDRDLTLNLLEGQQPNANMFGTNTYKRILQGIDEIKDKYFTELSDRSTFTINTHARELSARLASNHANNGSPLMPLAIGPADTRRNSEDLSPRNGNIYKAITSGFETVKSGLKSRAYPTSSGTNRDEAAYLVDSKKAE
jgi:hypothetical protein